MLMELRNVQSVSMLKLWKIQKTWTSELYLSQGTVAEELYYTIQSLMLSDDRFQEGIFETPVGLDPDFGSQRTQTLGLTRIL